MADKSSTKQTNTMNKMALWGALEATDPDYTKRFDKGTYKGTSINPVYIFKSLTEQFGACGIGWKYDVLTSEHVFLQDGQVLSLVDVDFYYMYEGKWSAPIRGSGGDFIVRLTKNGLKVDDDGRKKAITDALTNATRLIGKSADIHMGLYDKDDYRVDLAEKFVNKDVNWREVSRELYNKLGEILTEGELFEFQEVNESLMESMPDMFLATTEQYIEQKAKEIKQGDPQRWCYAFNGTKDANQWFEKAARELMAIKSISELKKWVSDNDHTIGSLSILKAKKYQKDGENPEQRIRGKILSLEEELAPREE